MPYKFLANLWQAFVIQWLGGKLALGGLSLNFYNNSDFESIRNV